MMRTFQKEFLQVLWSYPQGSTRPWTDLRGVHPGARLLAGVREDGAERSDRMADTLSGDHSRFWIIGSLDRLNTLG